MISLRLCRIRFFEKETKLWKGKIWQETDEPWHKRRGGEPVCRVGYLYQGAEGWPVSYSIQYTSRRLEVYVKSQSSLQGYTEVHQVPTYLEPLMSAGDAAMEYNYTLHLT
jgi:hypothetical protein